MSSQELNFAGGAAWVLARTATKVTEKELAQALKTLAQTAAAMETDCALTGLFPGVELEALFSREFDSTPSAPSGDAQEPAPQAMRAIGDAIAHEMNATGRFIMAIPVKGCGEVIVFPPSRRDVVLLATQTTLIG